MKAIRETICGTTILIQTMDHEIEIVGEMQSGRATQLTGVEDQIEEAYAKVKSMIRGVTEDIGTELKSISPDTRPKNVEMEFSVGVSAQAGPVLILSGKGEYGMRVKISWEFGTNEPTD